MDKKIREDKKNKTMNRTKSISDRTEIVFGLVGAAGTDFATICSNLENELKSVSYEIEYIKLSSLIEQHVAELKRKGIPLEVDLDFKDKRTNEAYRLNKLMDAGDELCGHYKSGGIISVLAMDEMGKRRESRKPGNKGVAYILKSIKRSEEVNALRQVYGSGFYLIGIYSSRENRKNNLAAEITHKAGKVKSDDFLLEAEGLIIRDQEEKKDFGQEVGKTFYLSDFFISIDDQANIKRKIKRFIELVFANPFHTPEKEEYAMFFAQASALRSGDLARQVGAAITAQSGEILSVGTNDTPCFKGGLYWASCNNDQRDIVSGKDSNTEHINLIIHGIVEMLEKNKMINRGKSRDEIVNKIRSDTYLANLTEFGRTVHAEMDALIQAMRFGISLRGGILYTTLFPCHNCTKHIVAAGIKKVIYIEPYPKSLAENLHKDSIVIDREIPDKVSFLPFEGVGPRRFQDLFSLITSTGMRIERKDKKTGEIKEWEAGCARPRLPMSRTSYIDEEKLRVKNKFVAGNKLK